MSLTDARAREFAERGVHILSPASTVIGDEVNAEQFEPETTIHPAVTIRGARTRVGRGCSLGKAGGGYFEDLVCGRGVDLFGGYFQDCVLLDGVTMRGHAEVRGGTLLEEGCEGAHHVGYKMTVMLPWVVAGSLVNFCDALFSGGRSRREHSEIGSTLALYNYSPWGDKAASLFGDVPRGVFMREAPIFVGGQSQIVSPVKVGFGSVIAAGSAVRRDVPEGRLYGEATGAIDRAFDAAAYGGVTPRIKRTVEFIGNLRALRVWYRDVRLPAAAGDPFLASVYREADRQLALGIAERVKRLRRMLEKLPSSLEAHRLALHDRESELSLERRHRRVDEHEQVLANADAIDAALSSALEPATIPADARARLRGIAQAFTDSAEPSLVIFVRDELDSETVAAGVRILQAVVDEFTERLKGLP